MRMWEVMPLSVQWLCFDLLHEHSLCIQLKAIAIDNTKHIEPKLYSGLFIERILCFAYCLLLNLSSELHGRPFRSSKMSRHKIRGNNWNINILGTWSNDDEWTSAPQRKGGRNHQSHVSSTRPNFGAVPWDGRHRSSMNCAQSLGFQPKPWATQHPKQRPCFSTLHNAHSPIGHTAVMLPMIESPHRWRSPSDCHNRSIQ